MKKLQKSKNFKILFWSQEPKKMIFRIFRNFLRKKKIGLIVAEFLELPCLKSSFPDHMTTGRRPYIYIYIDVSIQIYWDWPKGLDSRARTKGPGPKGVDQRAWTKGPGPKGLNQRAWTKGPGPRGLDQRAWTRAPGPKGLDQRAKTKGPGSKGHDQRAWTKGPGPNIFKYTILYIQFCIFYIVY